MPEPATAPRALLDALLHGISEGRWTELSRLYAEDAVAEQPLLAPTRGRIAGRDQIHAHFTAAADGPLRLRARNVVVHTTGDPEVIIAEFDYEASHAVTGRSITLANVQVLRVRHGEIQATRDYHDHLRLAAVAGRAEQLGAVLDRAQDWDS
jgi:ketosteroid isomerase-like protein